MKILAFMISLSFIFISMILKQSSPKELDYVEIADKVRQNEVEKLEKKYKIRQIGTIDGMIDCVQCLGASFDAMGPLSHDEARIFVVPILQDFLSGINENTEIRPYLKNYPFLIENIEINIIFYEKNRKSVVDPYITTVSVFDGKIHYRTQDPNNKNRYKNSYEETYEEAVAILKSQTT